MYFPRAYNDDCLEVMKKIRDGSVDMVLCDLPYGTTACKWDVIVPFEPLWEHYRRVAKPNAAIVLFCAQPFTTAVIHSNMSEFRDEWIWVKNTATGMMRAGKSPMRRHESICVFYRKQPTFNPQKVLGSETSQNHSKRGYTYTNKSSRLYDVEGGVPFVWSEYVNPHSVLPCNSVGNRDKTKIHPTQKPLALCEYLIRTYSNPGDRVLDNCAGSGTTGLAAMNTGRKSILIERDPAIFKRMCDRLGNVKIKSPGR